MSTTRRGFLAPLGGAAALPIVGKLLPMLEPEIAIEQVPIYEVYRGVVVIRQNALTTWRKEITREYCERSLFLPCLPNHRA